MSAEIMKKSYETDVYFIYSGSYLQKEHVYSTFHSDLYCCFYNGHRHSSRLNKIKERLSLPSIQVFHQEINIKGSAIFTKNLRP